MSFNITEAYLKFLRDDSELTMPIAAIESLVTMLRVMQPSTLSELINLVKSNTEVLKRLVPNAILLLAGCDLFMRFVLRNTNLYSDWESCKRHLVENGELFVERAKALRCKLAAFGVAFVKDDDTILVHLYLRVVFQLLVRARRDKLLRFRVLVTELRPTGQGVLMARMLRAADIPVELIVDNAVGFVLHRVDKIMVGAEGVAESGGIINHIGLYQIGCLAKANNKPFYVVTELHKFVRLFPVLPNDIPQVACSVAAAAPAAGTEGAESAEGAEGAGDTNSVTAILTPLLDFTPHEYITALITDLGVLTPSAVLEELIKMWYD